MVAPVLTGTVLTAPAVAATSTGSTTTAFSARTTTQAGHWRDTKERFNKRAACQQRATWWVERYDPWILGAEGRWKKANKNYQLWVYQKS
ncbi:MAG: hypothetical protein K0R62_1701 [Nonomuraea muscovyensis]|jgi:hypothetical protein|nr:hypothetical protein [Nonomuraea muscovyensis]